MTKWDKLSRNYNVDLYFDDFGAHLLLHAIFFSFIIVIRDGNICVVAQGNKRIERVYQK